jgi:hypothetical protein
MDARFADAVRQLHPCFERLLAMPPCKEGALPKSMPERGVYLFSEGDNHLYVGRSNRLRRRYGDHCNPGAPHNQAVFAFKLAREATGKTVAAYVQGPDSRLGLVGDPDFAKAFSSAKARVRLMEYRFTEQTDPNLQALLEIYCTIVLQCRYNDFDNH